MTNSTSEQRAASVAAASTNNNINGSNGSNEAAVAISSINKQLPDALHSIIRSFLSSTPSSSSSTSSVDKVMVDDDFVHITLSGNDRSNDSNDVVMDGESSAAIAEATAELAAASIASSSSSTECTSESTSSMDESKDDSTTNGSNGNEETTSVSDDEVVEEDKSNDVASLAAITKIGEGIERKVWELQRVTQRLSDHIIRLIALSWRTRTAATASSNNGSSSSSSSLDLVTSVRAAKSMSAKMEYESGLAGEWLFSQLMALDNIRGSSDVRRARKDMVARIKAAVSTADNIRARAKRAALAFHSIIDRRLPKLSAVPAPAATPAAAPVPAAATAVAAPSTKSDDKVAPASPSADDTKRSSPTPATAAAATPAAAPVPAAVPAKKSSSVRDPSLRWSPEFTSREVVDGAIITSSIPGIVASSLSVTVDETKRLLHITGNRMIKQRVIDHDATSAAIATAAKLDAAEQRAYEQHHGAHDDDEDDDHYGSSYGGWFGFAPVRRRPSFTRHQLRAQQQPVTKVIESEQWFDEELRLPSWLSCNASLYRTSVNNSNNGILTIAIPRVVTVAAQQVRPSSSTSSTSNTPSQAAKRRRAAAPQSQSYMHPLFGYQQHDEDNEEAYVPHHHHHPYGYASRPSSYYQPQYVRQSSPFGFGW